MSGQKCKKSKQTVHILEDDFPRGRTTQHSFHDLAVGFVTVLTERDKENTFYINERIKDFDCIPSQNGSLYCIPLSDTNRQLVKDQLSHFTLHRGARGQTSGLPG